MEGSIAKYKEVLENGGSYCTMDMDLEDIVKKLERCSPDRAFKTLGLVYNQIHRSI